MNNTNQNNPDVIYGDFSEVYKEIRKQYMEGEVELAMHFASIKTPDLTIEDVVKLYAILYEEIERDICVRFNEEDDFVRFLNDEEEDAFNINWELVYNSGFFGGE